jgi:iron complex outermembrane recepter protein
MNKLLTLTCLVLFAQTALCQSVVNIKGELKTQDGDVVTFATLVLHKSQDSLLAKVAVSDEKGRFLFPSVAVGSYFLKISSLGFEAYQSAIFEAKAGENDLILPNISLKTSVNTLKEVTVSVKKPFIEKKLDRTVMNVESSIVSTGSTALEVLERAPGVVVNQESTINMLGKQGVILMIDGRPSPLSGADLINYLKSIPSNNIERIELVTNPSSKYDAAGNAGIIDIRFKKNKNDGFNGSYSLSLGKGVYYKPLGSFNSNFRRKKINFYNSYSAAVPTGFTKFYINRKFFNENRQVQSIFDQDSYIKQPTQSHNARVGFDFYQSPKTVIGVMFNGLWNQNDREGNTTSLATNASNVPLYTTLTANNLIGKLYNGFGNLNVKHEFNRKGRELTADIDFGRFSSSNLQAFTNNNFSPGNILLSSNSLFTDQLGTINVKSIKADYTSPLKNGKFETGFKASLVNTDADIQFFDIINSAQVINKDLTSMFRYQENVNAVYANYGKEFKKLDFQLGLRLEHTVTNGKQLSTNETFYRNYVNIFPTAFINYKKSDKNQYSASYSRRIDRPSYRQLNPFRIFVDPFTFVVGDPKLRPSFTHSFEVSHTFKGQFVTTLNYSIAKDAITDIFSQDDVSKISYQIPANMQDNDQLSLNTTIPLKPAKWLNSNVIVNLNWNKYTSPLEGGVMTNESYFVGGRLQNNIKLPNGFSAELNGFYQSKQAWGLFTIRSLGAIQVGIQKVYKQATFKLAATDLLRSNRVAVIVDYQNQDFHTMRTWDSRVLTVSYTQRFGKSTVARVRQRTGGVEDEKRRAN